MSVSATIEVNAKGENELVIRLPVNNPLERSASGKSLVVASSYGNKVTDLVVSGPDGRPKPVTIGVNAYISTK